MPSAASAPPCAASAPPRLFWVDARSSGPRSRARKEAKHVAIPGIDISKLGVADANGLLQHGLEHGLQIARRTADDLEHLRRGRLLLQRFRELDGALTQLVEQPRILDGDDGLIGEIPDEVDLLVAEGAHFLTVDAEGPDQVVVLEHRHDEQGARAGQAGQCGDARVAIEKGRVRPDVDDVLHGFRHRQPPERILGREPYRPAQPLLGKGLRHVVHGDGAEGAIFVQRQHPEMGGAQLCRVRQDGRTRDQACSASSI
jgi:hypothetical protein